MRIVLWLLCAAVMTAPAMAAPAGGKLSAGQITEITLDHNPGMPVPGRPWPLYKVTFHRSGAVEYNGPVGNGGQDYFKGRISKADFDKLAQSLVKMNYLKLQRYYPIVPDAQNDSLSVVRNGVRKDITYGDSDTGTADLAEHAAFQKLQTFEGMVNKTLKHIHLTKLRPVKKR
jgi:hypothetical protein